MKIGTFVPGPAVIAQPRIVKAAPLSRALQPEDVRAIGDEMYDCYGLVSVEFITRGDGQNRPVRGAFGKKV